MSYQFAPTKVELAITPAIGATEETPTDEKICTLKFFCPWNGWTWYAVEYDGKDECFGYVVGLENEWGYFSLEEMRGVRGPGGLKIERDIHWKPTPMSKILAEVAR